jgi:CcmD family protein
VDNSLAFLFSAVLVTWLTIGLYLWMLSGRVGALRRDVERLEDEGRLIDGDRDAE